MSHVLEAGAGHVGPGEGLDPSVRFMRPYPSEGLICGYEEMIVGHLYKDNVFSSKCTANAESAAFSLS